MDEEEGSILVELLGDASSLVQALAAGRKALSEWESQALKTADAVAETWEDTVSATERVVSRLAVTWSNVNARIKSSESQLTAFLAAEDARRERSRMASQERRSQAAATEADLEEKLAKRRALVAQEYDAKLTAIREKGEAERVRIEETYAQKAIQVQAKAQAQIAEMSAEQFDEQLALIEHAKVEQAAVLEEGMAEQIAVSRQTAVELQRVEAQKNSALLEAETRYQDELQALRDASLAEQVAFFKEIEEAEAQMQAERNAQAYRFEQEQLKFTIDRLKEQEVAEARAQAEMNAQAKAMAEERFRIRAKSEAEADALMASAHRDAQKSFAFQMQQAKEAEKDRAGGTRFGHGAYTVNRAGDAMMQPGIIAGIPLAVGAITASDFNKSILQAVNNTTLASDKIGEFRENVRTLMAEFPKSAEEIANAQMRVLNYGFTGAKAMMVLVAATQAATAQFADEEKTAQGLAREMSLFGVPAEDASRFMNMLSAAARLNDMTLADWVDHAGRAYQAASVLGVSAGDATAAFTVLTKSGMDSAQAATAFAQILNSIVHPTKSAQQELAKLSKETGVNLVGDFSAAGLKARGLTGVINDLNLAMHGNADEAKNLMTARRGFIPLLSLMVARHQQYIDTINAEKEAWNQNNFIQKKSAEVNKQTSSQVQILYNHLTLLADAFQSDVLPTVNRWIGELEAATEWLSKLSSSTKEGIVDTLAFITVVGLLGGGLVKMVGQIGFAISGLQSMAKWFGIVQTAEQGAATSSEVSAVRMAASFGRGGVLALAIAAFAAYCVYWWQQITDAQQQAIQSAQAYADALKQGETTGSMGKRILTTIQDVKSGPGGIENTERAIAAMTRNPFMGASGKQEWMSQYETAHPNTDEAQAEAAYNAELAQKRAHLAGLKADLANLNKALADYDKSPAHYADGIIDTGGSQAQAIAAVAEHMKAQATVFRGHCEEFVRTAVQSVTHDFDRYYGDSAAKTMQKFQKGKIGFPYTPGMQLQPGDIVFSGKEGGKNGHAVIIGTNGEVVGTAPMPTKDMQWVVRPGGPRGGASAYNQVFGQGGVAPPPGPDTAPLRGPSSSPKSIPPAFDWTLPSSLTSSSAVNPAAQSSVEKFDAGKLTADAKNYKDVIADINEAEAQYVEIATKAGSEMEVLQHQMAAVQRRTEAYKQAEDSLKPALEAEAGTYDKLYARYVHVHDQLVANAAAQNKLASEKAKTHKDDTDRLNEIKAQESALATSARRLTQEYSALHKELTKAKSAWDSYGASLDAVKNAQDKEAANGARIQERMGVLSGQADSQFLQEHKRLFNAGQESYDNLAQSLTDQGRQAAIDAGISPLTANNASLDYLLQALRAVKNPTDQARESITALSNIIAELGTAAKKQAADSITSQGDALTAIARDPRMTTQGKMSALTEGVGNLAQSVLGGAYSSDMTPDQVLAALQQTNLKAFNIASTTYAEIGKLRARDTADAIDQLVFQNDTQRQHYLDLARYRNLDHDQFVSYMQGLTSALQEELATQTDLTVKQQEEIARAIAQNQQTVTVMQAKWARQGGSGWDDVGRKAGQDINTAMTDEFEHMLLHDKQKKSPRELFQTAFDGIFKESISQALKDAGSLITNITHAGKKQSAKSDSQVNLESSTTFNTATKTFGYWVYQFVNGVMTLTRQTMGAGTGRMGASAGTMGSGGGSMGSSSGTMGSSSGTMGSGSSGAASSNAARTSAAAKQSDSSQIGGIANTTSDVSSITGVKSQNAVTQTGTEVEQIGGVVGDVAAASRWAQASDTLGAVMPWVGLAVAAASLLGGLFGGGQKGPDYRTVMGKGVNAAIAGTDYTGMIDSGYSGASGMRNLLMQRQALASTTHNWAAGSIVVNSANADPVAIAGEVMNQIARKTAISNAATGST